MVATTTPTTAFYAPSALASKPTVDQEKLKMSKPALVQAVRKEYETAKRAYKSAGRKAAGTAKTSAAHKAYAKTKRVYKTIGNRLGKLTGIK